MHSPRFLQQILYFPAMIGPFNSRLFSLTYDLKLFVQHVLILTASVAARSKAWVCGSSLAGFAGSNPVRGVDDYPLRVVCVVK